MKDIDYIQSNLKPRPYNANEVVRLVNMKQAKLYISNKIYPIDIYTSVNKKEESVLVMVFLKEETQDAYKLWLNYALEENTV
jgi:hypothetical protein